MSLCIYILIAFCASVGFSFFPYHSKDSGYLHRSSGTPIRYTIDDEAYRDVPANLMYYREYVLRGIDRFMKNDLIGAEADFNSAKAYNNSQTLVQRGIILYLNAKYEEGADQFRSDISIIENLKMFKASDLRLWLAACLNKLGESERARLAIDLDNTASYGIGEDKYILNNTMSFYAGEKSLPDILDIIGSSDERDYMGVRFFGNFYLGLYYHSVGDVDMAKMFLEIPTNSNRYPANDMWYHVPRALYGSLEALQTES